jgi:1-acyl-sn-glycerol-3-phosphate acyltransferase
MRQWLGSVIFTSYLFLSVPPYALVVAGAGLLGRDRAYTVARHWVASVLRVLQVTCGLGYRVSGLEHLPQEPSVVLMKHSSAWETLAQLLLFPRQTWVLKRELMWAPFMGWVLPLFRPIAIDRRGGREAVQQVIDQGSARLRDGLWVVIFPEGTRVPAGQTRRYGISGAVLASAAGRIVIPVAHNAGRFWPRRGWLKRRGTIDVVIGPGIVAAGRDPRALIAEAQQWIEGEVEKLDSEARRAQALSDPAT